MNVTFCVDVKFGMVVQFCKDAKPCEMPSFVKTLLKFCVAQVKFRVNMKFHEHAEFYMDV